MTDTPDPPPLIDQIPSEELRPEHGDRCLVNIPQVVERVNLYCQRYAAGNPVFSDRDPPLFDMPPEPAR